MYTLVNSLVGQKIMEMLDCDEHHVNFCWWFCEKHTKNFELK